jgi:hypothetical protein
MNILSNVLTSNILFLNLDLNFDNVVLFIAIELFMRIRFIICNK